LFGEDRFGFIEKLMLGFALSALIIGFLGYFLNALPYGISTDSMFASLSSIIVAGLLIKILRRTRRSVVPLPRKAWTFPYQLRKSQYWALAFIVVVGIIAKTVPYMTLKGLLDLDPYNHYVKVNAILEAGRIPSFDPLSLAPNGTTATYTITPLGFEFIIVTLELMTKAPLMRLMGILPAVYGALTILTMFFLCLETTKSPKASLFTAFFAAFSTSWLLIYGLTMNPLAENVGLFLFPLALLFLARYIRNGKKSDILCSGILFGTMFYIHLFTVFYFLLTLSGYFIFSLLTKQKARLTLKAIGYTVAIGLVLSTPIILRIAPVSIQLGGTYSRTAAMMAFASGSYLALVPQDIPRIFNLPLYNIVIVFLWFAVGLVAVRIAWRVLRKNYSAYESLLLPTSWCLFLFLGGLAPIAEPIRNFLAAVPFSAPLFYAHRLVPYLTLAIYLLVAVAVTNFILPLTNRLSSNISFGKRTVSSSRLAAVLITVIVMIPFVATAAAYTAELVSWPTPQNFSTFFDWVKGSTNASDVFVANNWDIAMWLRAIGDRPTVFSHVHQDLVASDAINRMQLHAVLFNLNSSLRIEAIQLLHEYNVTYVVVASNPIYLDVINYKWVFQIQDIKGYIQEMDSRDYLTRVFSAQNIWVYKVNAP